MDNRHIKIKETEQYVINIKLLTFYDSLIGAFAPYQKYNYKRNKESWEKQASLYADKADVIQDIFGSTENEDWIPSFSKNSKNIIARRIQIMRKNLLIFEKIMDARECHFHPISNGIINFSIERERDTGVLIYMDNFRFNSEINFTAMQYEEDAVKIFDILYTDLCELLNWIVAELKACEEEYNRHKLRRFFRFLLMKVSDFFENVFCDVRASIIIITCVLFIIAQVFLCLVTVITTSKNTMEEAISSVQSINTPFSECTESTVDETFCAKENEKSANEQNEFDNKINENYSEQEQKQDNILSGIYYIIIIILLIFLFVFSYVVKYRGF